MEYTEYFCKPANYILKFAFVNYIIYFCNQ